ncbi:MAG TPA: EamA family transporter [Candidatus Limnocylindrales bacterium]|nr:EamA family transporter [Candidatus Limnocylindrales bacterium]
MSRQHASPLAIWAGILVLYVVWGSTYLGIKLGVETIPPFLMAALRFIPAGILLAGAVAIRHRGTFRRPTLVETRDTAIIGGFLLLGGMGLVAWGEQTVSSGIAALFIALMPMWLAIFARIFFGDRLPRMAVVGIGVGLVGVAILTWPESGVEAANLDPAGVIALILSPIFWAIGSLYSQKKAVHPAPALFATGFEMVLGGLILVVASVLTGELVGFSVDQVSARSWFGVAYLLVVGSLVGYTTFAWLIQVAPLSRVTTYAYVNPVVAVFLGWLFLDEPLSPRTLVAAVVIVAAVVLIVTARGRATPATGRRAIDAPEAGVDVVESEAVLHGHPTPDPAPGPATR